MFFQIWNDTQKVPFSPSHGCKTALGNQQLGFSIAHVQVKTFNYICYMTKSSFFLTFYTHESSSLMGKTSSQSMHRVLVARGGALSAKSGLGGTHTRFLDLLKSGDVDGFHCAESLEYALTSNPLKKGYF